MTDLLLHAATVLDQAADALGDVLDEQPPTTEYLAAVAIRCLTASANLLDSIDTEGPTR